MRSVKTYFLASRPGFFTGVIMPVALGSAYAWHKGVEADYFSFVLALMAAVLYHAGVNTLNDYSDFKNNSDNINTKRVFPFTGGSRMIQTGKMTPTETLMLSAACFTIGSAIGLYLVYLKGILLLYIGIFGLLSCIFYNVPPLFLAGRGLGELLVGLNFGTLTVAGSYYVQTSTLSWDVILVSLPLGFLITAILYINEFPDYEADKAAGKRNIVVRMGPEKGRWGFILIIGGAYLSLVLSVILGYLPLLTLAALVAAVPAVYAAQGLMRHFSDSMLLRPSLQATIAAHALTGILMTAATFF
ncbi:MAG: 1,4-dihydroxy-2-naphthoate octaprenyltransferase [Deltaproteobacteria bacterium]|nr:1,4-dihydroxy-2-naphthoate octaprenyltransferase [Deltaproteobacteria bacterium]